jgi:hypothetical protein
MLLLLDGNYSTSSLRTAFCYSTYNKVRLRETDVHPCGSATEVIRRRIRTWLWWGSNLINIHGSVSGSFEVIRVIVGTPEDSSEER